MKILSIIAVLILGLQAQASFYQTHCSNADNTLAMSNGHIKNELTVKIYDRSQSEDSDKAIKLDRSQLEFTSGEESSIKVVRKSSCDSEEASRNGMWSQDSYIAKEITIRKNDGTPFDKNFHNLSADKKSLNTVIVCHTYVNSLVICD